MAKILIIDDRPANRQFLTTLLGYQHRELHEASDGAEGLRVAREQRPDLIISDVLMPTMDGYEFVLQLRADPEIGSTPVIFSTAHYLSRESKALAEKCGVTSIIFKPCEPQEVLDIVAAALGEQPSQLPVSPGQPEDFDREHLRLVTNKLAESADELRAAHEKLSALIELSTDLAQERDPVLLLDRICAVARKVIGTRWTMVVLLEPNRKTVQHLGVAGIRLQDSPTLRSALLENGVFKTVTQEGRTICLSDVTSTPAALRLPDSLPRAASLLVAPLVMRGHVDGWICLADKLGLDAFTEEDEQLAPALAAQMAVAYANARLYNDSKKYASKLEAEISDRTRAEAAVRASEERYRTLFEYAPDGIVISDSEGYYVDVNASICRMLGYARNELIGLHSSAIVSPAEVPHIKSALSALSAKSDYHREWLFRRKDSSIFAADVIATAMPDGNFLGMIRDISERKRADESLRSKNEELTAMTQQLWQASKLATMGELSASIAHELNNPLATVGLRAEALLMQLPEGSDQRKPLEIIAQEVERMATLVNNLLQFSRRSHRQVSTLDPSEEIATSVEFVHYHLRSHNIEVVSEFADGLPTIQADRQQLRQLFLNLLTNASDAMPQGGKLMVRTSANGFGVAAVAIDFADTGEGITAANLQKIWEPFFTTKPEGRGTGLGLGICRRIVEEHGGTIDIQSQVGRGTTVHIVLPATSTEALV
jgi:PAS domain S-box-containing protein